MLHTPNSPFWARWSMRKSDRTIPRCQTGKTDKTKQKIQPRPRIVPHSAFTWTCTDHPDHVWPLYTLSYMSSTFCRSKPFSPVHESRSEFCLVACFRQDLLPPLADCAGPGWAYRECSPSLSFIYCYLSFHLLGTHLLTNSYWMLTEPLLLGAQDRKR